MLLAPFTILMPVYDGYQLLQFDLHMEGSYICEWSLEIIDLKFTKCKNDALKQRIAGLYTPWPSSISAACMCLLILGGLVSPHFGSLVSPHSMQPNVS